MKITIKNGEKSSLKGKFFLYFFIILLTFSHSAKNKTIYFFPLFLTGNAKNCTGKGPLKILFFFFGLFCTRPLVLEKNEPLTFFFAKLRPKVPKNTAKRAQVSFFQKLLFFRRDHANTQLYQHSPFFLPKKTIFSANLLPKMVNKLPEG